MGRDSKRRLGNRVVIVLIAVLLATSASAATVGASVPAASESAESLSASATVDGAVSMNLSFSASRSSSNLTTRNPAFDLNRTLTFDNGSNYQFVVTNEDTGQSATFTVNQSFTADHVGLFAFDGDGSVSTHPSLFANGTFMDARLVDSDIAPSSGVTNLSVGLVDAQTGVELARTGTGPHLFAFDERLEQTETDDGLRVTLDRGVAPRGTSVTLRLEPDGDFENRTEVPLPYDSTRDAYTTVLNTSLVEPGNYTWRGELNWRGTEIGSVTDGERVVVGNASNGSPSDSDGPTVNVDAPSTVPREGTLTVTVRGNAAGEIRVSGDTSNWTVEETDPGSLTTFPNPSETPYVTQANETWGHIFSTTGQQTFTLNLTAPNATGTYAFTATAKNQNATATEDFTVEVTQGRHESGVTQAVFDAAAGGDGVLSRSDVLDVVSSYIQGDTVNGVSISRSDILALVRYFLTS